MPPLNEKAKVAGIGTVKEVFVSDLIYIGDECVSEQKAEFYRNLGAIKARLTITEDWDDIHGVRLLVEIKKDVEPVLLMDWYMGIGSMLLDSLSFQLNRLDGDNYKDFMDVLVKKLKARKEYEKKID